MPNPFGSEPLDIAGIIRDGANRPGAMAETPVEQATTTPAPAQRQVEVAPAPAEPKPREATPVETVKLIDTFDDTVTYGGKALANLLDVLARGGEPLYPGIGMRGFKDRLTNLDTLLKKVQTEQGKKARELVGELLATTTSTPAVENAIVKLADLKKLRDQLS